jgi:hypothetical protein
MDLSEITASPGWSNLGQSLSVDTLGKLTTNLYERGSNGVITGKLSPKSSSEIIAAETGWLANDIVFFPEATPDWRKHYSGETTGGVSTLFSSVFGSNYEPAALPADELIEKLVTANRAFKAGQTDNADLQLMLALGFAEGVSASGKPQLVPDTKRPYSAQSAVALEKLMLLYSASAASDPSVVDIKTFREAETLRKTRDTMRRLGLGQ